MNNFQLRIFYWLLLELLLVACTEDKRIPTIAMTPTYATIQFDQRTIQAGQTIFVPAYSEIHYDTNDKRFDLAVTLMIHNTDLEAPIIVTSVRYYSKDGILLREYLPEPLRLVPLASADFFVGEGEQRGGIGTNFIVEWVAESTVSTPVVEAVMLSTSNTQGISFISRGQVIRQQE